MKALSVTQFASLKGQIELQTCKSSSVSNQSKFAPWKIDRPLEAFGDEPSYGKNPPPFYYRDYVMSMFVSDVVSGEGVLVMTPWPRPQDRRPSASFAFVGVPCGKRKPPPIRWSQAAELRELGMTTPGWVETLKSNPAGFCVDYKHLFFGKGSIFIFVYSDIAMD